MIRVDGADRGRTEGGRSCRVTVPFGRECHLPDTHPCNRTTKTSLAEAQRSTAKRRRSSPKPSTKTHVRLIGIKVAGGTLDSRNLRMMRTVSSGCSIGSKCDAPGTTASCAPGIDSYSKQV